MSNLVFPASALGAYIASKEPYQDVRWDEAASGKEVGSTWQLSPRWKYRIMFEVLNGIAGGRQDLQQMLMLFLRHCRGDSFLLSDPEDSSVTDMGFGVGDGATTQFQMQRLVPGLITDAAGFGYTPQSKPYRNRAINSSFETDSNADGLADNVTAYNGSTNVPMVNRIVPGMNGGKAQRFSWGAASTDIHMGVIVPVEAGTWVTGQWITISYFARVQGGIVGSGLAEALQWNNPPSSTVTIANPALTGNWQRYVFQVFWNLGATPESSNAAYFALTGTGVFGDLDFDLVEITWGQYGLTDLQPIETPAGTAATRTPSYWPSQGDGFEPVYDLSGNPTLYQDGDWMGRRQLYPYTRTNLLPWSQAFDNAAWSKTNAAITAAATTAPDGTATGESFNEGAVASVNHFIGENTSPAEVQGELRCYSIFVKANTLPNLVLTTNGSGIGVNFNLSTGVIDALRNAPPASGVQTSPLWPGWYRVWFVARAPVSPGSGWFISGADASYNLSYTGTSRIFYLWGAMVERVSNLLGPTPYIKTPSSVAVTTTDYTVDSLGKVTPSPVLPSGAFLSVDLNFYKRVRLANPGLGLARIVSQMWSSGLDLITQKPLP